MFTQENSVLWGKKLILLDKLIQFFGVCVGNLLEQTNPSTLASLLESLQVCRKDIEIQRPSDQASTETLTAKGSQRAQQNTPVTVGDSDNQVIMYKKR